MHLKQFFFFFIKKLFPCVGGVGWCCFKHHFLSLFVCLFCFDQILKEELEVRRKNVHFVSCFHKHRNPQKASNQSHKLLFVSFWRAHSIISFFVWFQKHFLKYFLPCASQQCFPSGTLLFLLYFPNSVLKNIYSLVI